MITKEVEVKIGELKQFVDNLLREEEYEQNKELYDIYDALEDIIKQQIQTNNR